MFRRLLPFLPALVSFLGLTALAHAQVVTEQALAAYDYYVRDYNVVTFGNLTLNGTHTDAGIAVGGNLTVGGSVISMQSSASTNPALYVNGQITLTGSSQFNNGYVSAPNLSNALAWTYNPANNQYQRGLTDGANTLSYNSSHAQTYVDPRTVAAPDGWNWATAQSTLTNASSTLASASATGSLGVSGQNLTFTSNASGVTVFNLDASKIVNGIFDANNDGIFDQNTERVSNLSVNLAADQYFVVNLTNATSASGSSALFSGINVNAGSNNTQLLWNIIPDANTGTSDILALGSNLYGSILAPLVDVQSNGYYTNGQLAANSFTQAGAEVHYAGGYSAPVSFSPVPEPSTYAIIASALCAVGFIWQRRRARGSAE